MECRSLIADSEGGLEEGMRGIIKDVRLNTADDDPNYAVYEIFFDFSKYEEYNKSKMIPNFYDQDGKARLYWHETRMYPSNCVESLYISGLDTLFNVLDEKKIEESTTELVGLIQKLIREENITGEFHSTHARNTLKEWILSGDLHSIHERNAIKKWIRDNS